MAGYLEITSNGVSYKGNNPSSKSWEDVIKPDPTILDVSLGNDDIIHYPTFVSDNSGNLPLYVDKSDTAMSYKPSTGELTATKFVGDLEGIAASATRLETARTIGGVSFDGTANITLPGVNSAGTQNTSGIAASATRLETARNINGVLFDGNADIVLPEPVKIDISNNNTSNTFYPTFASSTGSQTLYVDNTGSQMSYKPSTGELTATTFIGDLSGNVNNIYVGFIGNKATCVGSNSLKSNTGDNNTAIGNYALQNNTTGNFNTASGDYALSRNTSGSSNTATGLQSLYSNTNGSFNTASGANALLYNTSGTQNTASGVNALYSNTTGTQNTASGVNALYSNATGTQNTATGRSALYNNTTGNQNTALGYNSNLSNSNYTNTTCLGFDAQPTGSNQVRLGNSSTTTYTTGPVQSTSDLRDKTDVIDTQLGLNFINKLRPVDYKWDIRSDYNEIVMDGSSNTIIKHDKDGSKKRFRYHHGLIAQEVKSVMDELNIDFGGYQDHSVKGGEDQLTLGYSELFGPLIKAVQELSSRLSILESNQT